jgi:hypothetical protein
MPTLPTAEWTMSRKENKSYHGPPSCNQIGAVDHKKFQVGSQEAATVDHKKFQVGSQDATILVVDNKNYSRHNLNTLYF